MKFRELVKQSYEDLKNLTVTWYNVIALTILVIVLSVVTTPIIGIPAGLLGGSYYLKHREEKGK
ncbi:peptide resistance ABC transporter activity modulator VraH [Staphylococcus aureus]|uniref:peptide resistance ABC transporter activity modulator VraH n=1 Tax=Staphylococcus aureus TaxID=1280 RepID=UPI000B33FA14|nr:peptide resistance ABC transporter activity modulator VraH [Staphylococcus aureus]MBU6837147.1 peptide resistance ABC transporter activity modulator VraH [Staphylococcus aureus]QDX07675.1 peptide resistance ABC transporter activity modulator VraH [Staphylococcus aureus]HCC5689978.1 peptide resistance ABC transporter activity modulator VraH [Staphylococcus aureus]